MLKDEVRSFNEIRTGFFRDTTPCLWVICHRRFEHSTLMFKSLEVTGSLQTTEDCSKMFLRNVRNRSYGEADSHHRRTESSGISPRKLQTVKSYLEDVS